MFTKDTLKGYTTEVGHKHADKDKLVAETDLWMCWLAHNPRLDISRPSLYKLITKVSEALVTKDACPAFAADRCLRVNAAKNHLKNALARGFEWVPENLKARWSEATIP